MDEKDFYKILGVSRDATVDEIKKAYRKLAHQYHPDKHAGDKEKEDKFKLINEAYETLKDPQKRANYDRFGYAGSGAGFGGGAPGGFGADFQDIFGEVFSDFFGGGGRRRPGPERGADLRFDLEISFDEAAFGTEKAVKVERTVACSVCSGSGAKPGTHPVTCSTCGGAGQVRFQQGFFSIARTCPACQGQGSVIKDPCTECRGSGKTRSVTPLTVKIPGGVDSGSRLRLAGEGEYGDRNGPSGDLYIFITVRPHPIFRREKDDVICEVPISFSQAALGAEIEVPTIEGPAKLKVPAGTQSGKVFRLPGKGIASVHTGRRGDEQVIIKLETPTKLNKRQKELLQEFAEISGEDTTPLRKNFFSKVKEIFE
ncbi:MAG: molecular chaperone DnaJ [Deltaproteobacteria bacterium]|nr:molecular chaperone DnaJ [Deltaproteobacteria bacterium]MBZ0219449.1 molecular chaperone DnaJ [Deltaproteobacteria bacterium]